MPISYSISPPLTNAALNALFVSAWPGHRETDFQPILARSLAYVCASDEQQLVGFVNLAWDGGIHAFVLDTTVHAAYQRRGIGGQLLIHARQIAQACGIGWLHVDYEPQLEKFYRAAGFRPTLAGVLDLTEA